MPDLGGVGGEYAAFFADGGKARCTVGANPGGGVGIKFSFLSLTGRIGINPLSARFRSVRGVTDAKLEKTSLSADVSQRAFAGFMPILPVLNSKNN